MFAIIIVPCNISCNLTNLSLNGCIGKCCAADTHVIFRQFSMSWDLECFDFIPYISKLQRLKNISGILGFFFIVKIVLTPSLFCQSLDKWLCLCYNSYNLTRLRRFKSQLTIYFVLIILLQLFSQETWFVYSNNKSKKQNK